MPATLDAASSWEWAMNWSAEVILVQFTQYNSALVNRRTIEFFSSLLDVCKHLLELFVRWKIVFFGHCSLRLSSSWFSNRAGERWYGKNDSARGPLYTFATRSDYPEATQCQGDYSGGLLVPGLHSTKGCHKCVREIKNVCHSVIFIFCPR